MKQGLFVVTDMYPFHLQARKLNVWTAGDIVYVLPLDFATVVLKCSIAVHRSFHRFYSDFWLHGQSRCFVRVHRRGRGLNDGSWRWSYGIGCIYSAVVLTLITLFMEET